MDKMIEYVKERLPEEASAYINEHLKGDELTFDKLMIYLHQYYTNSRDGGNMLHFVKNCVRMMNEETAKEKFMAQEEIARLLELCIPSKEMREYLVTGYLSANTLAHILAGSLLPLKDKAKFAWGFDKQEMDKALAELTLKPGEMFYLSEAWYDPQIKDKKVYPSAMCRDYDTVLFYIRRDMNDAGDDRYDCGWYILEKWTPDDRGVMVNTYTYYLIGDEVIYFESNLADELIENRSHYAFSGDSLNLPIPFEVGDLLTVDCTPFMPPVTALLIEKGDNRDCCCLQVLYKDTCGKWKTDALKHGLHFENAGGEDYWPNMLSPLYRLSKFTGKLPEDERLLLKVQRYLDGDDNKGRELWRHLNGFVKSADDCPDELKEILEEI